MSSNPNQFEINPATHAADRAMAQERAGAPPTSGLSPEELAHFSQFDSASLVSELANSRETVPADSPLHKMSSDQLKDAMRQNMSAIRDFRSAQQSIGHMDARRAAAEQGDPNATRGLLGTPMFDPSGKVVVQDSEFQKAEEAVSKSARSAAMAGLRNAEYNAAVAQLEATNPNAPQPPADYASVTENSDGTLLVKLATGETYKGDPRKIIDLMSKSYVYGKQWTQGIKAENEHLKAQRMGAAPQNNQQAQPAEIPQPHAPEAQPNLGDSAPALGALPDESTMWLLNNVAKVAGFPDANSYLSYQQQRDQRLQELESKFDAYDQRRVAEDFMAAHPEFPGTQEAANVLDDLRTKSGLAPTPQNLGLLHTYAMQSGMYQPLPADVINQQSPQSQGRRAPPTPPQGGAPGNVDETNPWALATDELRKRVLERGGLGKALLEMPAGSSLGS